MRPVNVSNLLKLACHVCHGFAALCFPVQQSIDNTVHFSLFMIRDETVHALLSCVQQALCYVQSEYLSVSTYPYHLKRLVITSPHTH